MQSARHGRPGGAGRSHGGHRHRRVPARSRRAADGARGRASGAGGRPPPAEHADGRGDRGARRRGGRRRPAGSHGMNARVLTPPAPSSITGAVKACLTSIVRRRRTVERNQFHRDHARRPAQLQEHRRLRRRVAAAHVSRRTERLRQEQLPRCAPLRRAGLAFLPRTRPARTRRDQRSAAALARPPQPLRRPGRLPRAGGGRLVRLRNRGSAQGSVLRPAGGLHRSSGGPREIGFLPDRGRPTPKQLDVASASDRRKRPALPVAGIHVRGVPSGVRHLGGNGILQPEPGADPRAPVARLPAICSTGTEATSPVSSTA